MNTIPCKRSSSMDWMDTAEIFYISKNQKHLYIYGVWNNQTTMSMSSHLGFLNLEDDYQKILQ